MSTAPVYGRQTPLSFLLYFSLIHLLDISRELDPVSLFFDYDLPEDLIAQHPTAERDASRLMVLHRSTGAIEHHVFRELPEILAPGDLLILNDTRVIPARLIGHRERTGGKWEGLFLRETAECVWELLAQTKGTPLVGETFLVQKGLLQLSYRGKRDGHWLMEPQFVGSATELLAKHGQTPLPPYIRKGLEAQSDRERYQTVFSRNEGSVAAPTAGLHFTPTLLERLAGRGVQTAYVTLHVGVGTFAPVRHDDPADHIMHHEWADVPQATVNAINECRERGNRVIAVGTTATRALESAEAEGVLRRWQGQTNLFIQPPYKFRVVDAIITNFHLPRTTLLLMVGAFAGMEYLERAYKTAIENHYRFYSYGDAMLIL